MPTTPSIKEMVSGKISAIGPSVRDSVVDQLVVKETERRVTASVSLVNKLDDLNKELRKVDKPDQESFDVSGAIVSSLYSKSRLDEIKKIRDQITKIETALEDAFENSNFQKVFDLAK